jgi:hypothetical protein
MMASLKNKTPTYGGWGAQFHNKNVPDMKVDGVYDGNQL